MRCAYAQTPQGAIHYAEAGSGDAVLLLHANPRSHRYFRHVLPMLGERHRAIAADIPGFGNSHPVPRPATIRGLAECFVRFLDALGLERAHVVGLHTGNKIAAVLAADWPARVGSVVLAGQTHSLIPDKAGRDAAIRHIVEQFSEVRGQPGWRAPRAPLGRRARGSAGAVVAAADPHRGSGRGLGHGERRNAGARLLAGLAQHRAGVEANFAFDLEDALRRMEARTLVLELLTPEELHLGAQAEKVSAMMKRAQARALPGDGEAFETQPRALADVILQFLG